jgi:hypothetical protein
MDWARDRDVIADLLETAVETLQHHFEQCTATAH